MHRRYTDVVSPRGENAIRIERHHSKPKPRIRSTVTGRMEIEHITSRIEANGAKPDFGFPVMDMEDADEVEELSGWALIWDYVNSYEKFERVDNFIRYRLGMKANAEVIKEKKLAETRAKAKMMLDKLAQE